MLIQDKKKSDWFYESRASGMWADGEGGSQDGSMEDPPRQGQEDVMIRHYACLVEHRTLLGGGSIGPQCSWEGKSQRPEL